MKLIARPIVLSLIVAFWSRGKIILERWRTYTEAAWQEQQRNPPEFVRELRERIQRRREALVGVLR